MKIGDTVIWESQAGSYSKKKIGTIAFVISPHYWISPKKIKAQWSISCRFDGGQRSETSYLVKVFPTPNSKPVLYWPRVSQLKVLKSNI